MPFSRAGGMVEEAFDAIRQVLTYGLQPLICRQYSAALAQAALEESKGRNISSKLISSINAIPCLIYAVAFWAGSIYTMQRDFCCNTKPWKPLERLRRTSSLRVFRKGTRFTILQRPTTAAGNCSYLARDPEILGFDEATCALDSFSEKAAQAAINAATKQCTTIVIAHRLWPITNADNIVVMAE
ncbi:hypothetical protein P153DRAFT_391336 [Dothidotthia symphoricarpi CBS 119687]|uniref:ABC transmembrane type-1 domain-containing protein n=1 Tax=Dothidotthia symphoricarpi CBS 119687 TaxID=1392245 RepID=A0A6A5ZVJ8_9PLEO|nr:uncharacterized protein P153DRAFT_391336 [Dothidotthia symphoricarpi CBS 119687]KAF2123610.1 hypothetical protein P153DRAFT_391336 [Dothidotthia symphoricarpi CBS 119687]